MNKFRDGFVKGIKKEAAYQREQDRLKQKHDINDQDVIVVEKDNMGKFTVKMFVSLVRLIATIVLLTLVAIGLIALLYPEVRASLVGVLVPILEQVKNMANF